MLDTKIKFYKGRVALNVLAKDLSNAKRYMKQRKAM